MLFPGFCAQPTRHNAVLETGARRLAFRLVLNQKFAYHNCWLVAPAGNLRGVVALLFPIPASHMIWQIWSCDTCVWRPWVARIDSTHFILFVLSILAVQVFNGKVQLHARQVPPQWLMPSFDAQNLSRFTPRNRPITTDRPNTHVQTPLRKLQGSCAFRCTTCLRQVARI